MKSVTMDNLHDSDHTMGSDMQLDAATSALMLCGRMGGFI